MSPTYRPTHLLVVEDTGGGVNVAAVLDTATRLHYLTQQGLVISRHRVIPARAASEIYQALLKRFHPSVKCASPTPAVGSAWYAAEFEAVMAAIAEHDPETGEPCRASGMRVGDSVYVKGAGLGTVSGFTLCGRVKVSIQRYAHTALEVLAPHSLVEAS